LKDDDYDDDDDDDDYDKYADYLLLYVFLFDVRLVSTISE